MSCENRAETIAATSLTAQWVRSSYKSPMAECEFDCSDRTPTGGSDWCDGNRTQLLDLNGTTTVEPQLVDLIMAAATELKLLDLNHTTVVEPQLVDLILQTR